MPSQTEIRVQPKKALRNLSERQRMVKQVIVYICPTEDCPNYFGSTDFVPYRSHIDDMQFHRNQNDGTQVASHPRTECPLCREKGKHVRRIPYIVTEVIPLEPIVKAALENEEVSSATA